VRSEDYYETKTIAGVKHSRKTQNGEWKPELSETMYILGSKVISKVLVLAVILSLIFDSSFRQRLFEFGFTEKYILPSNDAHPIFVFGWLWLITHFFYFIIGHGLQNTYADTDREIGLMELLPFKLAFWKYFFVGLFASGLFMFIPKSMEIDSTGLLVLCAIPIGAMLSILMVYWERYDYEKLKEIHIGNCENE